ncbi:MAG: P-loop NTPase fold protein [Candidatus Krumholzibacteriia bacterium]
MEFKLPPIEVPEDDPFCHDSLNRKQSVESLSNLIQAVGGPFVFAVDSPWGTGKTTFLKMLNVVVAQQGTRCLSFNAWDTDFAADPMLAFIGEIERSLVGDKEVSSKVAKYLGRAKKIATLIARRAVPAAGKLLTSGILDIDAIAESIISEFVADTMGDAVEAYAKEKKLNEDFVEQMAAVVERMGSKDETAKLVLFVDELDRCRPTYAIALLERIKHLFSIPGMTFVLAVDKRQLNTSLAAVYGEGIDSEEYLRRFIDLEFQLPPPDSKRFAADVFRRFGFNEFFDNRKHPELQYESDTLVDVFVELSELFGLSLRAREQCFTRIRVAMLTTEPNRNFFPIMVVVLVILRAGAPDVFRAFANRSDARVVLDHIRGLTQGENWLNTHPGAVTEANLIAVSSGRRRNVDDLIDYKRIADDEKRPSEERDRARTVVNVVEQMRTRDKVPGLSYLLSKLELPWRIDR